MGLRGPQPKPSRIRELEGNPGKRRVNKREPKPKGGVAVIPDTLSAGAVPIWRRLTAAMVDGVYKITDEPLLAVLCEQVALQRLAVEMIAVEGPVAIGSQGQPVVSAWAKLLDSTAGRIASISKDLGLTPAARQSLTADDTAAPDDEFAEFLH